MQKLRLAFNLFIRDVKINSRLFQKKVFTKRKIVKEKRIFESSAKEKQFLRERRLK